MSKARTLVIKIVVNKKERDQIRKCATGIGMSVSAFARIATLRRCAVGAWPWTGGQK